MNQEPGSLSLTVQHRRSLPFFIDDTRRTRFTLRSHISCSHSKIEGTSLLFSSNIQVDEEVCSNRQAPARDFLLLPNQGKAVGFSLFLFSLFLFCNNFYLLCHCLRSSCEAAATSGLVATRFISQSIMLPTDKSLQHIPPLFCTRYFAPNTTT